ncbi:FAD-binding oxidoreductase [Pedobacter sp. MC2016-15]|uniref:FAD-binding oxidoreductase n=1 Tax=Pedobacter sp. MC2016-15 TaxID=2994473 RepID=UPI0022477EFE|nr:FAD-binding oxidoreductase [Pedobacter sp. MC2016-15]MCX2481795.1 FAD-binding oxidoreductase [Pedobacter sp. MC2016-15]
MQTYTLTVIDLKKETEDTITISFKQPGLKKIKYQAGQYLSLIFKINGRRYIRPYSFSSAPGIDPSLQVTVKRIPNGIISNHIHDLVKVGDLITVMPPMGDFIFEPKSNTNAVYLWGVGSGITPLISLTKAILVNYPQIEVHLVYGNRCNDSTIFLETIQDLVSKYQDKFKVYHFLTTPTLDQSGDGIIKGRINQNNATDIVLKEHIDTSLHFICGPSGLKESVKSALTTLQISSDVIFSEDFELITNPEDFVDIATQFIQLKFGDESFKLEVIKGKNILESALDAGIELPYSCQTGNCDSCKGKLKNGELKVIGTDHHKTTLKTDEFLLCCSYPLTEGIYIEVNKEL